MSAWVQTVGDALMLGLSFSPIAAAAGSAVSAGIARFRPSEVPVQVASAALSFVVWLAADGWRAFEVARDAAGDGRLIVGAVIWMTVSAGLGYVFPRWAGMYVGRHVTRGTGWLSSAFVAGATAFLVARIAGTL